MHFWLANSVYANAVTAQGFSRSSGLFAMMLISAERWH